MTRAYGALKAGAMGARHICRLRIGARDANAVRQAMKEMIYLSILLLTAAPH